MSENILKSLKLHYESYGKLVSGTNSGWIKSSRGRNPKRLHPRELTLATVICYSIDTTQLHAYEIYRRLQIYKITGKDQPLYIHTFIHT